MTKSENISITYLNDFDIAHEAEGLKEASGLTLSHDKKTLLTVSDNTKKLFTLNLDGTLESKPTKLEVSQLEGITLDSTGNYLIVVGEKYNEILKIDLRTRAEQRRFLNQLKGFGSVEQYFSSNKDNANKGLEGTAWNTKRDSLFVMKEGKPGLLLELSGDLESILGAKLLNVGNGFAAEEIADEDLDFSGICYDSDREYFWIVSDKARKVFLYDWVTNMVIEDAELIFVDNGIEREVIKPEGIVYNSGTNRLYIVTDKDKGEGTKPRLYVFEIGSN